MLSRALSIATVTLLIGCITAVGARAQENLEAGKSPSQIFSGTCSACHKSPRGLLKNVPASSLPGYLRQHYTTGSEMASLLASFLISNGAADPRYQAKDQPKQKDAKQDGRPRSTRPLRPPATAARTGNGGLATRIRGDEAARPRRRRARRPRCQAAGKAGCHARRQSTCGWSNPDAVRDRRQIWRQAKARQARPSLPPKSRRKPRRRAGAKLRRTDLPAMLPGLMPPRLMPPRLMPPRLMLPRATYRPTPPRTPPRPRVTSLKPPSHRETRQARQRGEIRDRQG